MRVLFVVIGIILATGQFVQSISAETSPAGTTPNIIMVITDDMGWGDVGFNGQKMFETPTIDRLANQGVILNAFYSGSTVCGPSRASLMTGRHQGTCKIRGNPGWNTSGQTIDLDSSDMTIAKELKRAGYATACIGKWGLNENLESGTGHPLKQGFDLFWGYNTHREAHFHWAPFIWHNYEKIDWGGEKNWEEKNFYSNDVFTDEAVKFINEKSGKEPFFLYLAYTITHLGITVPEDSREPFEKLNWPQRDMPKGGHYRYDDDQNAAYAGMVSRLDGYMDRIVKTLHKQGIEKNTLILFTSDNGPHFDKKEFFDSNGIYRGYKRNLTEGGIIMPAFAWWPGTIEPADQIDQPWGFWDVLPTFCDIANTKPSKHTDGISFLPSLKGQAQKSHDYLYWEFNESAGPMQAVRFGNWKAIRLWNTKTNAMGDVALYDLSKDPSEKRDLAKQNPELVQRALRLLKTARVNDPEYPLTKRKNLNNL